MSLTQRIFDRHGAGLILGALLQWIALYPRALRERLRVKRFIDAGAKIFITLLKMLVPFVFVFGLAAQCLGDTGSVGRLW